MWIWEATNLAAGELEARGDHIEPGDIEKKIGEIWPENAQRVVEHLAGRARNIMNKASARYEVSRALTIAGVQRPHITRLQRMIETTFWEAVREAAHERLQLRQWIWEAFDRIAGADWGNGRGVLTNEIIDRVRTTWPDEADRILEQLALTIGNVIDEAGALTVMQNALEWARHPSTDAATPPLRESAEEDRG
jgi:hypothetical protein